MINIAICDDSKRDADHLKSLCECCKLSDSVLVTVYYDGDELIRGIKKNSPDILFLDVELPQKDGVSLGKQIREFDKNLIIIFSTAYPQYAIDAYDCEAFYYLLKPCKIEKIEEILNRAVKKLGLLHTFHVIKLRNKTLKLPISEIRYVEYVGRHVVYHAEQRKIEAVRKFSDVYNELKKYAFCQIHQGYIVNLDKVKDIRGYAVILEDGTSVPISVRKKKEVLMTYAKYVEGIV